MSSPAQIAFISKALSSLLRSTMKSDDSEAPLFPLFPLDLRLSWPFFFDCIPYALGVAIRLMASPKVLPHLIIISHVHLIVELSTQGNMQLATPPKSECLVYI